MSTYEIKESHDGSYALMRNEEPKGYPNNAEYQFWYERNEAREEVDLLKIQLNNVSSREMYYIEMLKVATTALNDIRCGQMLLGENDEEDMDAIITTAHRAYEYIMGKES